MKYFYLNISFLAMILNSPVLWAEPAIDWSSDKYIICDTPLEDWPAIEKSGVYHPNTLETNGFIHCTRPNQMLFVANKYYVNQTMMIWLIDPLRLHSPLKYEGALNSNLYPHVYGPINISAIIDSKIMEPNSDGTYDVPREFLSDAWKYNPEHFAFCEIDNTHWVWALLKGEYQPKGAAYISCTNAIEQIYPSVNQITMVVDLNKVIAPIKKEGSSNSNLNVHIYGPLNMDAVIDVVT